jgi:hypothetical protein
VTGAEKAGLGGAETVLLDRGSVWVPGGFRPGDRIRFVLSKALATRPERVGLKTVGSDREVTAQIEEAQEAGTGTWRRWTALVVRVEGEESEDVGLRWSVYDR